uniref:Uncharacterized protein n=1 Tax=Moniliophthora roreri TaxID=221103 RepID=A0A0W0FQT2_MONRR
MSINHSSRVSIKGKNTFNHVHGHQFNGPIEGNVVFSTGQEVVKRTEYDEFEYVKRGHIVSMKEIHSEDISEWDWKWQNGKLLCQQKSSAQRTIYTVELINQQSKFTAMIYKGKDAQAAWEDDFQQFSRIDDLGSFRLFGINQSAIPALIFHHELVPMAHIFTGSLWMNVYIKHLSENMGCGWYYLWMNTASGVIIRGPEGPSFHLADGLVRSIAPPPTVDMLKDDTSLRFFSKLGPIMDEIVLRSAGWRWKDTYLDDLFPTMTDHGTEDPDDPAWISPTQPYPRHLPMSEIEAVARRPQGASSLWSRRWCICYRMGLVDEAMLDGGLTRFKFDPTHGGRANLTAAHDHWPVCGEWLSQSYRIFDALDVTEGEENFFVVEPSWLEVKSTPRLQYESFGASFNLCDGKPLVEEIQPSPVYLFLRPFPMTISELVPWFEGHFYFWSFDETGRCEMSEEEYWRDSVMLHSWPTSIYTTLRDWQEARGFDPTTSNWAQELGYPELEIIGARKFNVILKKLLTFKKTVGWEAFAGSGISACGL